MYGMRKLELMLAALCSCLGSCFLGVCFWWWVVVFRVLLGGYYFEWNCLIESAYGLRIGGALIFDLIVFFLFVLRYYDYLFFQ